MKYLFLFCLIVLSSCTVMPGYYTNYNTTLLSTYPYNHNYYKPNFWWHPKPNYLGNVYNNYYINPKSSHTQTNLPLHNGPFGGRRK